MNSLTKKQNHCGECQVLAPTKSQLEEKWLCLFFFARSLLLLGLFCS